MPTLGAFSLSRRRLIILGSTGSIGTQALGVVAHLNSLHERGEFPMRYDVVGLAAGTNAALLFDQGARYGVRHLALANGGGSGSSLGGGVFVGSDAAERLVRTVECDMVLAAMVGSAGLPATLAAVELGLDVAIANKESLVAAGGLVVPAAEKSGSRLLPVDSEHSALWQCLTGATSGEGRGACPPLRLQESVSRVILTASGGPFRAWSKEQIHAATPAQALRHPTWSMGPKVSIDSASLMNKALEIIEAHWLFGVPGPRIEAVIHPQSIVHAMAEFTDGSVIAQMASPDMRGPIQHALAWPIRCNGVSKRLDFGALGRLEFEPPDHARFPALALAYQAIEKGGTAGAILNAANETAVEAFIKSGRGESPMPFGRITELVGAALAQVPVRPLTALADCQAAEAAARDFVVKHL